MSTISRGNNAIWKWCNVQECWRISKWTCSELAEISDIPVRTIQQYEQNQKNINAAKAETVVKLAKALNCTVEALMEAV